MDPNDISYSVETPVVQLGVCVNVTCDHHLEDSEVVNVDTGAVYRVEHFWKRSRDSSNFTGRLDTCSLVPGKYTILGDTFTVTELNPEEQIIQEDDRICNTFAVEATSLSQKWFRHMGYRKAIRPEITQFVEECFNTMSETKRAKVTCWHVRDLMRPFDDDMQFVRVSESYPHEWYKDEDKPSIKFGRSTVKLALRAFLSVATIGNFSVEDEMLTRHTGEQIYATGLCSYPQSLFKPTRLLLTTFNEARIVSPE